ncbi:MAG: hypothetical protein SFZ24_04125 [Planctomycetota bacterium]|nr:hypothetical protein [Planctomycetota bacterium]
MNLSMTKALTRVLTPLALVGALGATGGCESHSRVSPSASRATALEVAAEDEAAVLERIESAAAEAELAIPVQEETAKPLDWSKLEALIADQVKYLSAPPPPEELREKAVRFAQFVNSRDVEEMQQYHVDRAAWVIQRERITAVTMAEGVTLRGTASSAGGSRARGSSTRTGTRSSAFSNSSNSSGSGSRSTTTGGTR